MVEGHLNPRLGQEGVAQIRYPTAIMRDDGDDGVMWYVKSPTRQHRLYWTNMPDEHGMMAVRPFGGFMMLVVKVMREFRSELHNNGAVILPQVVDFMWRQPTPDIWTWEEMRSPVHVPKPINAMQIVSGQAALYQKGRKWKSAVN